MEEKLIFKGKEYEISCVDDLYCMLDDIVNTFELDDDEDINIRALLCDTIDFQESDTLNDIKCMKFMKKIIKEIEEMGKEEV